MPTISSLLTGGNSGRLYGRLQHSAQFTLYGPISGYRFIALDANRREIASFTLTGGNLSRGAQHICSFKHSSLSGSTTMDVHGQKVKVEQSWEGMQYGKNVKSPHGTLKWRAGSGGLQELRDGQDVIARGKLPGLSRSEPYLEIFIAADEFTMDMIISSWITMLDCQKSEGEQLGALAEVVGAIAG
jgi:hypothetical protein